MRLTKAAVLAAAAALLVGCSLTPDDSDPQPTARPETGRLPDVTLESLTDGPAVDLGSIRGPLMVNVWASWCTPCKKELPFYAGFARAYDGRVRVLGIDFQDDNKAKALRMLSTAGATYPVLRDFDGELRAIGLPKLMLVDVTGKVVFDEYIEIKSQAQLEELVAERLGVKAR